MQPSVLATNVKKRPKAYPNLIVVYDKQFQDFLERIVNLLLSIAVFLFVRIFQISDKIHIIFDVLLFIKHCDALDFEFFVSSLFEYFGYYKILNTFFLILWR